MSCLLTSHSRLVKLRVDRTGRGGSLWIHRARARARVTLERGTHLRFYSITNNVIKNGKIEFEPDCKEDS